MALSYLAELIDEHHLTMPLEERQIAERQVFLTLKALNLLKKKHGDQRVFFNLKASKMS